MQARMTYSTNRVEPWMTDQERIFYRRFVQSIEETLHANDVNITPMVALRVNDVGILFLLVRRLESELGRPNQTDDGASTGPASSAKPVSLLALIDGIGKAREKLRKSIKDLEECYAKGETPEPGGLADSLKPMLEKAACAGT